MELDNEKIDEMKQMDIDDLMYAIGELSEEGTHNTFDMGDMCDGLHFLLNKASASKPTKGNLLSEAIVGSEIFAGEDVTDSISYVEYQTAHEIFNNLEELDFESIISTFNPNEFADNNIYPNIWLKEEKADIEIKLQKKFDSLKEFYKEITSNDSGLIVCIY